VAVEETLIQFKQAAFAGANEPAREPERTRCNVCGQFFSSDARFCPFDGEALVPAPEWSAKSDPLLGTVIDKRYEVVCVLGEGGMGTVYEVKHVTLGRRLAVKALRSDLARDVELGARFIQEAKAAAAVAHPNVVQITDFGSLDSGQPYFVMELLDGLSLRTLIRSGGPIPAARAVNILRQVAEALGAAHDKGIIHRDLKPDNIHVGAAVGDRHVIKVLDFGLAKVAGKSKLTKNGIVFGTPHYMSPEQATGEAIDHRSDIYSLGVVMYEMFTGKVPFEADTYMGVLTKHMYMQPVPPSRLIGNSRHLGALEDITLRCLEKKPANRFATMTELLERLDRIVRFTQGGSVFVSPSEMLQSSISNVLADALEAPSTEELQIALRRAGIRTRKQRSPAMVAAGAVGGAAVLALIVWAIASSSDSTVVGPPSPALSVEPPAVAKFAPPPPPVVSPVASAASTSVPEPPAQNPVPVKSPSVRPAKKSTANTPSKAGGAPHPARARRNAGEIIDPWAE
jgi:serine/threonine-protein kinase